MRRISILLLVVVLAACGGDADDGSDAADSPTPVATPVSDESDDTEGDDDDSAAGGATSISFTGAETGEITDTGSCSGGPSGDGLQLFTSLYDEDEDVTWMFHISIPQYDGPGEYEVGDSLLVGDSVSFDDTSITFSNNAGGEWGSTQSQGGQVVVNADEVSGTVDVTVVAEDGSSEIHLSGAWSCTR
jgi:hypothetical protein